MSALLEIRDLHAEVNGKAILQGINLTIRAGELHAVMGPNGSGKSTLASVLTGHEAYTVTRGEVLFKGNDLLSMPAEERARAGVFLSFQYPVEIPGVTTAYFLRSALNAVRKARGEGPLDAMDFLKEAKRKLQLVGMQETFLNRSLNEGFSGGEKKRNEIFQLAMLEPTLAILDETDSGLDIDALKMVSAAVNAVRSGEQGLLVITHYQRLLNYLQPDHTHVLMGGKIVQSGGRDLAMELEARGYAWLHEPATEAAGARA